MVNRVLVIIAGLLGIVICLVYLAIAVLLVGNPFGGAAPQPTAAPTETQTPKPTFTATPTRPRATNTPYATPTPEPTETPLPPTATVVATATPTRTPTPRPEPGWTPPPPALFQIDGDIVAWPNCGFTGVYGVVRGSNGQPLKDIQLRVWKMEGGQFTWSSDVVTTDVDGNYRIGLADSAVSGRWFVQVLQSGDASWNMRGFDSSEGCQNGLQQFRMNWRRTN